MKRAMFTKAMMFTLLAAGLTVGCGVQEQASSGLSARVTFPMVVMMGGNNTCGEDPVTGEDESPRGADIWPFFKAEKASVGRAFGIEIPWLASCHSFRGTVYFMTSEDQSHVTESTYAGVHRMMNEMMVRSGAGRMVLWGHSYGGWQAVNTVSRLNETFPLDLVTVDPINREVCNAWTQKGCTSGVLAMGAQALERVAHRVNRWAHYYQTRTSWLHATPIPQAEINQELPFGHFQIDTQAEVWEQFRSLAKGR